MDTAGTRQLLTDTCERWMSGGPALLSLLADDATWTIHGSSPIAGTYHSRRAFEAARSRVTRRLAPPATQPVVDSIVVDGDDAVVLWHGDAVAVDGVPYCNTYAWFMTLQAGQIVTGGAFFDDILVTDLLDRLPDPDRSPDT